MFRKEKKNQDSEYGKVFRESLTSPLFQLDELDFVCNLFYVRFQACLTISELLWYMHENAARTIKRTILSYSSDDDFEMRRVATWRKRTENLKVHTSRSREWIHICERCEKHFFHFSLAFLPSSAVHFVVMGSWLGVFSSPRLLLLLLLLLFLNSFETMMKTFCGCSRRVG